MKICKELEINIHIEIESIELMDFYFMMMVFLHKLTYHKSVTAYITLDISNIYNGGQLKTLLKQFDLWATFSKQCFRNSCDFHNWRLWIC